MKILFSLLFIWVSIFSYTQNYKFVYSLDARLDSISSAFDLSENMVLFYDHNQKSSYFVSENKLKRDSIEILVRSGSISKMEAMANVSNYPRTYFDFRVFKNLNNETVRTIDEIMIVLYEYKENLNFDWKIQNDTLTISNLKCRKATTNYAGRNYTAWYTDEILIPEGSYKFKGLPGLIVKLYDDTESYVFTLTQAARYNDLIMEYHPKKLVQTSFKDFYTMRKDFYNNPIPTLESFGSRMSPEMKKHTRERYKMFNNFIEIKPD